MVETALGLIPQPYRMVAIRHRELIKFAFVGGTTWIIDTAVFLVHQSDNVRTRIALAPAHWPSVSTSRYSANRADAQLSRRKWWLARSGERLNPGLATGSAAAPLHPVWADCMCSSRNGGDSLEEMQGGESAEERTRTSTPLTGTRS